MLVAYEVALDLVRLDGFAGGPGVLRLGAGGERGESRGGEGRGGERSGAGEFHDLAFLVIAVVAGGGYFAYRLPGATAPARQFRATQPLSAGGMIVIFAA